MDASRRAAPVLLYYVPVAAAHGINDPLLVYPAGLALHSSPAVPATMNKLPFMMNGRILLPAPGFQTHSIITGTTHAQRYPHYVLQVGSVSLSSLSHPGNSPTPTYGAPMAIQYNDQADGGFGYPTLGHAPPSRGPSIYPVAHFNAVPRTAGVHFWPANTTDRASAPAGVRPFVAGNPMAPSIRLQSCAFSAPGSQGGRTASAAPRLVPVVGGVKKPRKRKQRAGTSTARSCAPFAGRDSIR